MTPIAASSHCVHTVLDHDIHHFIIAQPSRRAVDEWISHLNRIHDALGPDDTMRQLLDYRTSGAPPIAYGGQKAREWLASRPHLQPSKVAVVHASGGIMSMVEAMFRLLNHRGRIQLRFFQDEAAAITWLREN